MMTPAIETRSLTKRFGRTTALDSVTLTVPAGSIAGLIGRNGSGKTTLLYHLTGQYLPTTGGAFTLGTPCGRLSAAELARVGVVYQATRLLEWMTVRQHLRYVGSFYARWDHAREARLLADLDLDPNQVVAALSPGNVQKLALLLAIGHHPDLLLLDEPASGLDPVAREQVWDLLLDIVRQEGTTLVISSHILRDVERLVDRIVCLEAGRLTASRALDDLEEEFAEWIVTRTAGQLPEHYGERFIVKQETTSDRARLVVRTSAADAAGFRSRYGVEIEVRPLNLESLFPILIGDTPSWRA
jgi:ABC-2 type transport system ATP-binding protein